MSQVLVIEKGQRLIGYDGGWCGNEVNQAKNIWNINEIYTYMGFSNSAISSVNHNFEFR